MPDLSRTLADIDAAVQAWERVDGARWTPDLLDDDGPDGIAGILGDHGLPPACWVETPEDRARRRERNRRLVAEQPLLAELDRGPMLLPSRGLEVSYVEVDGVDVSNYLVGDAIDAPVWVDLGQFPRTCEAPLETAPSETAPQRFGRQLDELVLSPWQVRHIAGFPNASMTVDGWIYPVPPPLTVARYGGIVQMSQQMVAEMEEFARRVVEARARYRRAAKRARMRYLHCAYRAKKRGWR